MDYPFESHGVLTYDPPRGTLKTKLGWWLTIELSNHELARYYRWWVDREWLTADTSTIKRDYHSPPHRPHISVIRGERPKANASQWGRYRAGERVAFRYSPVVKQTSLTRPEATDRFWFIETHWDGYSEMRQRYGLPWQQNGREFRGHITVARTYT